MKSVFQCEKNYDVFLHGFLNVILNYFSEIRSSMFAPPIWHPLFCLWIQEAVITGYIKNAHLGQMVGVRDGSRGARMNLLSVYDHVPLYRTRPST